MDITPGDGPNKGKVVKAIFESNGDTLKFCYGRHGGDWPKEFTSTKENMLFVAVYKRQK
ncbi:MAG: hypothetical protein ACJ8F7_18690 [Gemmataceae bacterium]